MAGPERGLEDPEFVRIELPLDDGFAQSESAVDEHHVPESAVRIQGEDDARRRALRDHHLLHRDGEQDAQMIESVLDAVHDGPVGEDRGEAVPAGGDKRSLSANPEIALVLPGEAGLGEVLGRRARPDRHRESGPYSRPGSRSAAITRLRARRQRRSGHQPTQLGSGLGDRADILAGDAAQNRPPRSRRPLASSMAR